MGQWRRWINRSSQKRKNKNLEYDVVDITKFDLVEKTIKKSNISKIDILINNAGITGPTAELWNYSLNDWNENIFIDSLKKNPHIKGWSWTIL